MAPQITRDLVAALEEERVKRIAAAVAAAAEEAAGQERIDELPEQAAELNGQDR